MKNGMTITEKILAAHASMDSVGPGDIIQVQVDLALANDITAPLAIRVFNEIGTGKVFDTGKIALVPDHFVPNKDILSAKQVQVMRMFAKKYGITHFFELGEMGIEHVLLPEKGLVLPGDVVIGADSHTCTYGALGAFAAGLAMSGMAFQSLFRNPLATPFTLGVASGASFGASLYLHTGLAYYRG